MIRLFTGLPGAGKTAHAVAEALKLQQQGRPVYVSNINGMNIPGAIPFEDPRKWEELPSNAVLIVDEAQRYWRASRSLDVPPEVQAMETHRHLGIDFLLTTQQPTYLLKHLRGLVGEHTHHLRRTKAAAQTWTWNGCCDDPDSLSERDRGDVSMFVYPKHVFGLYQSTEQDTHKPGIPRRWKFVAIAAVMMLLLFTFGPDYLKKKTLQNSGAGSAVGSSPQAPSQGATKPELNASLTQEQYLAQALPRHQALAWSAPIFDGRKAVSQPEMWCMSSEEGTDANGNHSPASARCITEQGTRVAIDPAMARRIAISGGAYNPYRQPVHQQAPTQQGTTSPSFDLPPPVASFEHATEEQQARYGSMRDRDWPAYKFDGIK
ncbi:MAG TPA: zonular occludens toxin domain-containing protein [Thermomonas sp.]